MARTRKERAALDYQRHKEAYKLRAKKWRASNPERVAIARQKEYNEFKECWALSNLQPKLKIENIRKGNRFSG